MNSNQFFRKTAIVATGAIAMVIGAIGPAHAANATLYAPWGSMTHIDDGDKFYVCDTRVDGHAVTGGIEIYWATQGVWQPASTWVLVDGGDSGCSGYGKYDVETGAKYRMKLCWGDGGADGPCEYKVIYE